MALPPEPLSALIDQVALAFTGRVTEAERVEVDQRPRAIGSAPPRPAQQVTVALDHVLFGAPQPLQPITKPPSAYVLVPGVEGVFVVDKHGTLLGQQGPDTWSVEQVQAALGAENA